MPQARTASASRSDPAGDLGKRVRRLREGCGLSLRELAARSGVSAPMLSQVERGDTSPTLAVAVKIAAGLGLSLSQLLRLDDHSDVVVVRKSERRTVRRNGHRYEELSPALPGNAVSLTLHTVRAGIRTGAAGEPTLHAAGSRETAVVESGRLVLVVDGERYELSAGDSVTFEADLPHHFENPGPDEAVFLAVVTAGLRAR